MKNLGFFAMAVVGLTAFEAQATFGPSAAISCSPSGVSDAGYHFTVEADSGSSVVIGKLSQITYGGSKSLGSEEMIIRNVGSGKTCNIQIKQKNDVDGNEFRLVIQNVTNSLGPKATLEMKLDGKSIGDLFKGMTCHVDQGIANRVCKTSFGGAIYQNQSDETASTGNSAL